MRLELVASGGVIEGRRSQAKATKAEHKRASRFARATASACAREDRPGLVDFSPVSGHAVLFPIRERSKR